VNFTGREQNLVYEEDAFMSYQSLFKPLQINTVEIKNRIIMSPMAVNDAYPAGYIGEQGKAYYAARAKGGVGLIIVGGSLGTKRAWEESPFTGCYRLDNGDSLGNLSELVDLIHAFDTKIFVQLIHGFGRMGSSKRSGKQPISCTAEPLVVPEDMWPEGMKFPGGYVGETPREISIPEIIELEDEFANSALRTVAAGFDGIEIVSMLSYLAASFLSPRVNRRTDMYGGNLQNRMRFLLNTIHKTRDKVGPDFPLGVRLICNEHVEGGLTIDDCVEIAKVLESEGVDYISLMDGCYETMKYSTPSEDGTLLEHGEPQAFKKALKIPIVTNNLHNPDLAESAVAENKTDMVALGRPMLADPEWANKVKEGRVDKIIECDRDNFCIVRLFFGLPVRCKLNPNLGRERYMSEYWQPPYTY